MLNFSVHTYELYTKISYMDYSRINKILYNSKSSIREATSANHSSYGTVRDSRIYSKLKIPGINQIELIIVRVINYLDEPTKEELQDVNYGKVLKYGIKIICNPYNALNQLNNSDFNIANSEDLHNGCCIIALQLKSILGEEVNSSLKLKRCDFCVNLPFENQEEANEYIKLLSKGVPPKSLKELTEFNNVQHRLLPKYPESFLLQCKSYSLEIYNKHSQMNIKHLSNSNGAVGTVRIELRANDSKLKTLKKNYKIKSDDYLYFLLFAPHIANIEIPLLISKLVGSGSFLPFNKTIKLIEKNIKKESTRQIMTAIVKHSIKRKRNDSILEDLGISYEEWKYYLQKFNSINCSPITIPYRSKANQMPGVLEWDSYF